MKNIKIAKCQLRHQKISVRKNQGMLKKTWVSSSGKNLVHMLCEIFKGKKKENSIRSELPKLLCCPKMEFGPLGINNGNHVQILIFNFFIDCCLKG